MRKRYALKTAFRYDVTFISQNVIAYRLLDVYSLNLINDSTTLYSTLGRNKTHHYCYYYNQYYNC